MSNRIVKQPNGKFAIWSTIVDDFTFVDMEPQDIIDEWAKKEVDRLSESVTRIVAELERGEKPYAQFTESFDECVEFIRLQHGDDTATLEHFGLSGCERKVDDAE